MNHNTTDLRNKLLNKNTSVPNLGKKKQSNIRTFQGLDYESTGCYEADLPILAIRHARAYNQPLKRIILQRHLYDKMDEFYRANPDKFEMPEELRDGPQEYRKYNFDGVPIDRNESSLITRDMQYEYFSMVKPEESLFENRASVDYSSLDKAFPDRVDIKITKG